MNEKLLEELEDNGVEVNDLRLILADARAGMTDEEIMRKWAGVRIRIRRIDEVTNEKIWRDYREGRLTIAQIAKRYGCTDQHVYNTINRKRLEASQRRLF